MMERSPAAIDEGVLQGLLDDMGGDREVVKELIQSFLEEGPRLLAQGRAGLVAGDLPEVQRAYHTLKSTAATFGAMPLANLAKEVELGAKGGKMPEMGTVEELETRFEAAKKELLRRLG